MRISGLQSSPTGLIVMRFFRSWEAASFGGTHVKTRHLLDWTFVLQQTMAPVGDGCDFGGTVTKSSRLAEQVQ